ncbi:hypothetical protein Y1Q_0023314 [Alligator mississippiensis]|uniref:Uncharacterized protein n=1 Tax=Alligator mississippiensis TaxID=8496 RepID=A0A151NQ18_ALLMI|nr:hypothetical protein Y1Q_0023314 [Alligator mississippiensis]
MKEQFKSSEHLNALAAPAPPSRTRVFPRRAKGHTGSWLEVKTIPSHSFPPPFLAAYLSHKESGGICVPPTATQHFLCASVV